MTSLELFRALGDVSSENLAGADALQRMPETPVPRRYSVKRAALLAAVIALLTLLVGCAAAYVLHLQDLKVRDYRMRQNPAYDVEGNQISVPTHPLQTAFSLQGANQQALAEWLEFDQAYDPDAKIAIATDQGLGDTGIPDNYHYTYGCYSWEMVHKLDEIIQKYDLKLLSTEIDCDYRESSVLFGALGIDPVYSGEAEYSNSFFYPEGVFHVDMTIHPTSDQWPYENTYAGYHYSRKAYLDLAHVVIRDFDDYTQWHYTRKDGETVLLVTSDFGTAWIFADKPDAFLSVSLSVWEIDPMPMPKGVLEEIAENFDLNPQPQAVDMEKVEALRAEALAAYNAQRAESQRQLYTQGYESYIQQMLDAARTEREEDGLFYGLYDLNGDGTPELLPGGKNHVTEILSLRDGESYRYADFNELNLFGVWKLTVCQDHVLALYDLLTEHQWVYLRAEADGIHYLEGLFQNSETGTWYSLPQQPPASPQQPVRNEITPEQAQAIQDAYIPLEDQPQRQQMRRYGEPVTVFPYTDPYARYIAEALDQRRDAGEFTYALMDLNGDGVEELITKDSYVHPSGNYAPEYWMNIHTIVNGERVTVSDTPFNGICEDGIFMLYQYDGTYYAFYRMEGTNMVEIDRFFQEPSDLYWGRVRKDDPDPGNKAYSEEDAMALIQAYKPITLDMKPFSEYPLH